MPDSRLRRPRLPELFVGLLALSAAGVVTFAATAPPPAPHSTRLPALHGAAFRPDPRPLPGSLGPVAVSGTINGASQSVTCPVGDQGTVTCQVTGTWSATLIFEGTVDNLTWATVRANAIASDTLVTAPAANGLYVLAGNFTAVRVRDSAYTSGSAVITMRATPSSSANVPVSSVGGTGGGGGGGGAATIADGADITEGALADAAVGDASGTVNSHLRQIAKTLATAVPVTGTFFQATQPVSGTVTVTPSGTQTVSGTVTSNQGTQNAAGTASWNVQGAGAAGAALSGNPVLQGVSDGTNAQIARNVVAAQATTGGGLLGVGPLHQAVVLGANPTAVTAGQMAYSPATRGGIPFVLGGHPNTITLRANYTTAQTDTAIITVAAGTKIVVTGCTVTASNADTVNTSVVIGFGTANTPTTTGVFMAASGIPPGGGVNRGDGQGVLGIGADDEDVRITSGVPTSGSIDCIITYFTTPS